MSNTVQIKRGSGAPTTSEIAAYELAYDYTNNKLYIHDGDSSSVVEIGGGLSSVNNSNWSGTDLSVANGGTGASSLTSNAVLTGNGTNAIQAESNLTFSGTQLTNTGDIKIASGSLGIGTNPNSANGRIAATSHIEAGVGSGAIGLTINDGGGNSNITFNHTAKVPEQNGNSGRIEVNTDGTGGEYMAFELAGNVTSGVSVNTSEKFRIDSAGADVNGSLTVTDVIHVQGGDDFALGEVTNTLRMKGNSTNAFNFLNNGNGWANLNFGNAVAAGSVTAASLDISGNVDVDGTLETDALTINGTASLAYTSTKDNKLDGIETGATADQSASEILTLIKTVDGNGSGLDADTLDGVNGANFLRSNANDDFSGTLNYTPDTGTILSVDGQAILQRMTAQGAITIGHDDAVIIAGGDTSGVLNSNINNATETVFIGAEGGLVAYAFPNNDTSWSNRKELSWNGTSLSVLGNTVWHAGNDGAGTGLHADLLDGQHGSYYENWTDATNLTGTIDADRIPNLAAGKITSGTFATARIPNLAASKITSGTIAAARIAHNSFDIGDTTAETGRSVHETGIYTFNRNNGNLGTGTDSAYYSVLGFGQGTGGMVQIAGKWTSPGNRLYFRSLRDTVDDWWDWNTIWHSGHQGSGSGLDADTLDGSHASAFLTSVPNHSGNLITSGTVAAARIANLPASKITSGTIPSARLDSDTAHLSGTQTFSGAKTFSNLASFAMDGNTISGIDDSGEFTNNDSHIMTSAAVEDKILSYGYTTASALGLGDLALVDDIPANKIVSGTIAAARIPTTFTTITSIKNSSLVIGRDDHNGFHFSTDNAIKVEVNNVQDEFRFASGGTFHADADIIAYSSTTASDKRLKENIESLPYGLDDVMKMKPVQFDWKKDKANGKERGHDIGVIAQEMEEVIPEVVKEYEGLQGKDNFKAVDYSKLVPVLIKSIQELKAEIEELKK